jgi:hypothetical protein
MKVIGCEGFQTIRTNQGVVKISSEDYWLRNKAVQKPTNGARTNQGGYSTTVKMNIEDY